MKHECKNCGKVHTQIPANARLQKALDGDEVIAYMWECECKSTMTKLIKPLRRSLK